MDWFSILLCLGMVGYIYHVYHRREREHRARVAELRRGVAPSFEAPKVRLWNVVSSGLVALVLIVMTSWFAYMEIRSGKTFGAFAQVGLFFGLIGAIVVGMFVTSLRRYIRRA